MTNDVETALALHALEATGREPVRDPDLVRIRDLRPDMEPVLEEVQFLRQDTARLEIEVGRLQDEIDYMQGQTAEMHANAARSSPPTYPALQERT